MSRPSLRLAALALSVLAAAPAAASSLTALYELDGRPALLDRLLADRPDPVALDLSDDGHRAAAAFAAETKGDRATVRLLDAGDREPTDLEMPGAVRAVVFGDRSDVLYVLLHREAKKREGDSYLVRIEFDTLKARREMRLPGSARALARYSQGGALLVASRNEIRTILTPDLRSGKLYRVPGENLALRSLPRSDRVLLGREDGLWLVDLGSRPTEDGMPVLERLTSPAAVDALATSRDGKRGLARDADGGLLTFWLQPLRAVPEVPADYRPPVVATRAPAPPEPPPAPEPTPAEPEPETIVAEVHVPEPEIPAEPEIREPEPVRAPEPTPPAPEPEPEPEPEPDPVEARPAPADPAKPAKPAPQLRGRITGPVAASVEAVVLLGPNTILREAARTRPAADGTWSFERLAPGRYRVQLSGGGSRQIVSDPAFRTVVVEEGKPATVPDMRALRML
jgi:hypothetical protein